MKFPAFYARHPSLFLVLLATLMTPVVHAATITVNTFDDETTGGDNLCSLREAVIAINSVGANAGDCVADTKSGTEPYGTNDTIILDAGTYTLSLPGLDESYTTDANGDYIATNTPNAAVGDLDLMHSVKIIGAGAALTKIEWDPAVATSITTADRIFHIYTTDGTTTNDDVTISGVTLAYGKTFQVDLGPDPNNASLEDYFRRAGGAIALGAGANVVKIDPTKTGAENANAGGLGGSTGGESGTTNYSLTLNGVVVEDNSAQGDGGGLYLAAPTTATNLIVRNNRSTTNGGGIYNEANTNISEATFSGNIAEGGGGIFCTGSNIVKIKRSTFSGNRAVGGGAISNRSGVTIELENSTLSGNIARDVGAGLYTNGSVFLDFVTVANNISGADSSTSGSGINTFPAGSATMTLKNVLLSGNKKGLPYVETDPKTDPLSDQFVLPDAATIAALAPSNCGTTSGGGGITVASLGHNLSGDVTCYSAATVLWFGDTSDINNMDPKIGPLAANGGLTLTHALLSGSPAIGAGAASAGITTDQRGVARDNPPDIGAYELPASASSGGGSSGGCVYDPNGSSDWTLLILLAAGIGGLLIRHRRKDAPKQ